MRRNSGPKVFHARRKEASMRLQCTHVSKAVSVCIRPHTNIALSLYIYMHIHKPGNYIYMHIYIYIYTCFLNSQYPFPTHPLLCLAKPAAEATYFWGWGNQDLRRLGVDPASGCKLAACWERSRACNFSGVQTSDFGVVRGRG